MTGVGEQSGRIREIAIEAFDPDKGRVERDADQKRAAEIDGRMMMAVMRVIVVRMIVMCVAVIVRVGRMVMVVTMMAVRMAVAHSLYLS